MVYLFPVKGNLQAFIWNFKGYRYRRCYILFCCRAVLDLIQFENDGNIHLIWLEIGYI